MFGVAAIGTGARFVTFAGHVIHVTAIVTHPWFGAVGSNMIAFPAPKTSIFWAISWLMVASFTPGTPNGTSRTVASGMIHVTTTGTRQFLQTMRILAFQAVMALPGLLEWYTQNCL